MASEEEQIHTMVVREGGELVHMHSDVLYRPSARPATVRRVSTLEFEDGHWVARLKSTGEVLSRGPLRDRVAQAEVRILAARLAAGEEL